MPRENDKWRVVKGDNLWNIANSVYGNGLRWTEIADANGISRTNPIIYPGQLFTLPGITSGSSGIGPTPSEGSIPSNKQTPKIIWFTLDAGEKRKFQVIWQQSHNKFEVRWEIWDLNGHLWLADGGDHHVTTENDRQQADEFSYPEYEDRFVIRCSVRAIDDEDNALSEWAIEEYDLRNTPPDLPPDPTFEIDNNNQITVRLDNISEKINADSIEIAIYQDDTIKYNTVKVGIDTETHFAKYIGTVDPGHTYKIRCRAVRGTIYSGWTNFSSNDESTPNAPIEITTLRPQIISEQMSKKYGAFIEWPEVSTAKQYEVQWTTNIEYFDVSNQVSSQTTEEGQGPRLLIMDIEIGHEYFFRVRSINNKGNSKDWTPIKSVTLGTKPSAPTTWSNVSSAVLGENLNLYWTHNATDGSIETYGRIHFTIIDSAHPDKVPMEYTKVIQNTKPEDQEDQNSIYVINTNDPEWSKMLSDGFILKWKVQTTGVIEDYSDWSIEREINVYAKPTLVLDIQNKDGNPIEDVLYFPFYLSILSGPYTQKPLSYYIEIVSNDGYNTVDNIGEIKTINPGDKVYQKYYDPDKNAWYFLIEMTPANIDLQNGKNYTINVTVSMDSGLSITSSKNFNVIFGESGYSPYGDIIINKETLVASIHPYCMENIEDSQGKIKQQFSKNCKLAVYRREYDGSFTEIATEIENGENTWVVDPHPSLDYARYRIVARTNDTGSISYCDIDAVKVNEPSIVIQWSEKWSFFDYDPNMEDMHMEVPWAGSMLKIPYNIDISENKNVDVSLITYAGRKHPVSYYGTQIGEEATWNVEIPADDKELLYALRRLSKWTGDVYVREPSGTGYWANIGVSLNKKHLAVTIPVTFTIKRVEGGI